MADKLGKKKRKKLVETAIDELSLEDVLTAGGDKVKLGHIYPDFEYLMIAATVFCSNE